jgi:hypothetical protein
MAEDVHTGRCLCGLVSYRTHGAPLWVAHCHCNSCRRHTGSPVATFVGFDTTQVEFGSRDRSIYESSPGVRRGFCARCGTPVSYESDRTGNELHLYVCTLDDPQNFVPTAHVFHAEHVPWFEIHDALPRFESGGSGVVGSWGPLKQ